MIHLRYSARRNPRSTREIKHPMVVLVRRFDPTGEELTTWAPLYVSDEGVTFFSPPKAKAAALKPPRGADIHVGDLIVTVPAEGVSSIDEYATGLYVVTPDGVKAAPKPLEELGGPWLATWGQNARKMFLSSRQVDRCRLVMAACDCAETVLHPDRNDEVESRIAIETARGWCLARTELANVQASVDAADDARTATTSAAAWAATAACVGASADAVDAAVQSVESVAIISGDRDRASREATYRKLALLVERWIPLPVVLLSTLGYPYAIPFDLSVAPTRTNPSHSTHYPLPRSRHR